MSDYAELRAALDEAPTPGPWRVQATGHSFIIESHTHTESFSVDSEGRRCRWSEHTEATAKLIAACSPDTIRALLAERDALVQDNAGYVEHASKLDAENVRLREALLDFVHFGRIEATGDQIGILQSIKKARAALAQNQGD